MTAQTLRSTLLANNQAHLIPIYESLAPDAQAAMQQQLAGMDLSIPMFAAQTAEQPRGPFSPPDAMTLAEAEASAAVHEARGLEALSEGAVGAVLLAGGQGTRLGYEGPKGCMNIGLTTEVSLFALHFATLTRHSLAAGHTIPLFIMTSHFNHAETEQYLEAHDYFGYPRASVILFEQEMAPCTDFAGQILMESPNHVAESPNGNGGWFSSMEKSGLLPHLKAHGIRWLNVFAVDNALQAIADPRFVGAVLASGMEAGAKVIAKTSPEERVGVLCLEDGKPSIVEYYEMSPEMSRLVQSPSDAKSCDAKSCDAKSCDDPSCDDRSSRTLVYRYGVILNYLFSVARLMEIQAIRLPIHRAAKVIPYYDFATHTRVTPSAPNGYKYETLVLDMVRLQRSCLAYEVARAAEFAPIKNRTGVDSLDSARALLTAAGFRL